MQPFKSHDRITCMRILILTVAFILIVGGLAFHFAALRIFNLFVPKDSESFIMAQAVAYGPDSRQKLDIYKPSIATSPLPVLLFVHGGSWKDGSREGYEFVGRAFAARGYLTLVINYRLLPDHKFPAFVEDVALAIAWAEKQAAGFDGDAKRIYVVGHSAGAYNAALAILDRKYLVAAGVDASSLRAVATLAGPFDFLPLDTPVTIATFGGVADQASTQPINFARGDAPPFLLLTGTEDTTVFPKNSRALEKRLLELGAVVEAREYEGVGHVGILTAIANPFRREDVPVLDDVLSFFAKHAKPQGMVLR